MKTLVESIYEKDYTLAEEALRTKLATIAQTKLHEMKKAVAARDFSSPEALPFIPDPVNKKEGPIRQKDMARRVHDIAVKAKEKMKKKVQADKS